MRVRAVDGGDAGAVLTALRGVLSGSGPALALGIGTEAEGMDVPEGTAAVLATSGSTGRPHRVVLSRDALVASARATAARIGEGSWLLALPAGYIAGLQVLTRSIVAGTEPVILDGPFDTAGVAAAAASMPRPAFTSLVPAQLARLLQDDVELRGFAAILVGGQRLDPGLRLRAEHAGAPIVRTYGSTETSGGCVYDGRPLEGVEIRVVGGEVQLNGPTLATGYLGDERTTDVAFPRDPDGTRWYRTGDAGELRDGVLAVTGRLDDVYVSGGINVSVARLTDALRTVSGLEHAVVVAVPDERWGEASVVVVATDRDAVALLATARDAAAVAIGPHARPARILPLAEIPVLPSGKPDLVALRVLAASGP